MEILQFVTESLGDSSYLLVAGDTAAVVDPQRDVRPYIRAAEERGARITHVFETHVHNDYISGGPQLAALGATIVAPADAALRFDHYPVRDGDEVRVGDAIVRAVATPGHTFEHTAYLAIDGAGFVRGAFTGGSLIIGGAARSDLLGSDETEKLTRLQWESGRRVASLIPEDAELLPTHGGGSFCSSGATVERRATLREERPRNGLLSAPDFDAFRQAHLSSLPPIPAYYRHMAPRNREGATGEPPRPAPLSPADVARALDEGVAVVDVRDRFEFARGYVPGTVLIEEGESTLAYVGWLLPFDTPVALIVEDAAQAERIAIDLFRIGYERVRGYLPFAGWRDDERAVATLPTTDADGIARELGDRNAVVLDVRFAYEHESSPVPGARRLPIDRLSAWVDDVAGPVAVFCGSGVRSTTAASFLARRGVRATPLIDGGANDVLDRLAEPSRAARQS